MPAQLTGAGWPRRRDRHGIASSRTRLGALLSLLASLLLASCESSTLQYTDLRIYDHPYADVDWVSDVRLKAQHHDHVGTNPALIMAYDRAGYDVVSLMDYSGHPTAPYALRHRLWPPSQFVKPELASALHNIKFFLPNAEEVGLANSHFTTPFLDRYIEAVQGAGPGVVADSSRRPSETQYGTLTEAFSLVRRLGGMPCLAHPRHYTFSHLPGVFCAEIYTAFEEASGGLTRGTLLTQWDFALRMNQKIWGIAVNDHFGPGRTHASAQPEGMDSGKIMVFAKRATPESYREAFNRGAILAIKDLGLVKDLFPTVYDISVASDYVHIETTVPVTWIAHGAAVKWGPTLFFSELRPGWRYVRAEVHGYDGSVVYTQAFSVRPQGDADGDYDVDVDDIELCSRVASGLVRDRVYVEACQFSPHTGAP